MTRQLKTQGKIERVALLARAWGCRSSCARNAAATLAAFFAFFLVAFLTLSGRAMAEGWQLTLGNEPYSPPVFLAIDKNEQQLFLFRHASPVTLSAGYGCTTGQVAGDKKREGDLKTPEGVYFVKRRLTSGLDYDLYGNEAYTLNYPNPVDRLRGKTGSGIWVHGRGHEITERETRGCVAMNNPDLANLRTELASGTPVLIARDLEWLGRDNEASPNAKDAAMLRERVRAWAKAWENRSDEFFSFYDGKKFSRAQRKSFSGFRNHKKRLFRNLPWVQVLIHDVQLLPGPGYWVTTFGQFYRSPSLSSEGEKRLYWMKDADGRFRIVGREWRRGDLGLGKQYVARLTQSLTALLEEWRTAWISADIEAYMEYYAKGARQGDLNGLGAIKEHKARVWAQNPPQKVLLKDMKLRLHPEGVAISVTQRYQSTSGYSDLGQKTLILSPAGETWKIIREEWKAL